MSLHAPAATTVEIKVLHPKLGTEWPLPQAMTPMAAGFDLVAALEAEVPLAPGAFRLVSCGFAMALPQGFEAQIRPRSGLAYEHGITCLNTPGTIDADYRGEVKVLLINHGDATFVIKPGSRVAQMVVAELPQIHFAQVHTLQATARGAHGFGSTGQ